MIYTMLDELLGVAPDPLMRYVLGFIVFYTLLIALVEIFKIPLRFFG